MIWKSIVRTCAIAAASALRSPISGIAPKMVEAISDFAGVVHNLILDVRDSYRPELHYMRGPGPKWRAKHQSWLRLASDQHCRPNGTSCRSLDWRRAYLCRQVANASVRVNARSRIRDRSPRISNQTTGLESEKHRSSK